jgi:hypothetical protein
MKFHVWIENACVLTNKNCLMKAVSFSVALPAPKTFDGSVVLALDLDKSRPFFKCELGCSVQSEFVLLEVY